MGLIAVLTTVATEDQALALARAVVRHRLAACAQWAPIRSVYLWQGQVQQEPEQRLLLKTETSRVEALMAYLREHHPYELPAIYAVPVSHATPDYAQWVRDGVQPDDAAAG